MAHAHTIDLYYGSNIQYCTVTINLDPPFFVCPGPYISPALIFQKYMDPHACYQL